MINPEPSQVAEQLLYGFEGRYFQSDGYAAYDAICEAKGIIHLGSGTMPDVSLWKHYGQPTPKSKKKAKKNTPPSKAQVALSMINALYAIERQSKDMSDDERFEY